MQYLATHDVGIGIVDFDIIEPDNLYRHTANAKERLELAYKVMKISDTLSLPMEAILKRGRKHGFQIRR